KNYHIDNNNNSNSESNNNNSKSNCNNYSNNNNSNSNDNNSKNKSINNSSTDTDTSISIYNSDTCADENEINIPRFYPKKNISDKNTDDEISISCINRIDVPVSGIVILATNNARHYHRQMMDRSVEKHYIALVKGKFTDITVDKPLKKTGSLKTVVSEDGKLSKTIFRTLKAGDYSLIECIPVTGRSHQIRAHLSHIGFPIVGDTMYGYENLLNDPLNKHERCTATAQDCNFSEYDDKVVDFVIENCYGTDNRAYRYQNYVICLHAYKYKIFGKEFVADLPKWAQDFLYSK
ncbi:Bifunctional protein RIB2, partial [Dictyocoela roeselum]